MTFLRLTTPVLFVALAFAGCSKADRAATTPPVEAADAPGTHEHDHDFSGAVVAFHDTMAPLWHAEAGDTRTTDTCAAMDDLIVKAEAIEGEPAPDTVTDDEAWQAASRDLTAAARVLAVTCNDTPAEFDATFAGLHEAFHALVKLAPHDES